MNAKIGLQRHFQANCWESLYSIANSGFEMVISMCPLIGNLLLNVNENSSWKLCSSASFGATYLLRKRKIDKYKIAEFLLISAVHGLMAE